MTQSNQTSSADENKAPKKLLVNHDIVVEESFRTITIGGESVKVKKFSVKKSPEMELFLNQQALIKAATPRVRQQVVHEAIDGLKSAFMGGGMKGPGMKKLMGLITSMFLAPNSDYLFGGECSPEIDKKVCNAAMMAKIQTELPSVLPGFLMDSFSFGGDEPSGTTDTSSVTVL